MIAGWKLSPGRYHLLFTSNGRPAQDGWWATEEVAGEKFRRWIGTVGNTRAPRVTLTDEETDTVLTTWPRSRSPLPC
ncbi:hypothetical protein ACFQ9Z_38120 [Streptomyces sp. NPDC056580]|uniref:hypothetical protein n=1 Tax=Streptomyces sp. NPDC056580 TaxID=3345872 RepID=UPI003685982D